MSSPSPSDIQAWQRVVGATPAMGTPREGVAARVRIWDKSIQFRSIARLLGA